MSGVHLERLLCLAYVGGEGFERCCQCGGVDGAFGGEFALPVLLVERLLQCVDGGAYLFETCGEASVNVLAFPCKFCSEGFVCGAEFLNLLREACIGLVVDAGLLCRGGFGLHLFEACDDALGIVVGVRSECSGGILVFEVLLPALDLAVDAAEFAGIVVPYVLAFVRDVVADFLVELIGIVELFLEDGVDLCADELLLCGFGIGLQLCDGSGEFLGVEGVVSGEGAFVVLGVEVSAETVNLLLQTADGFVKVGSHVLAVVLDECLDLVVCSLKFVELCGERIIDVGDGLVLCRLGVGLQGFDGFIDAFGFDGRIGSEGAFFVLGVEVGAEGFNLLLQSFDSFGELSGHVLAFFIHKSLCIVEGCLEGLNLGREFGEHLVVDESLLCGFGIGLQLCDGVGEVLGVDGVVGGEGAFFVLGVEVGAECFNLLLEAVNRFGELSGHVFAVFIDEFLGFIVGFLKFVELCTQVGINLVIDKSLFLGSGSGDECGDVALQTFHRFHDALDVVLKRTVVVGVIECCAQVADGRFDGCDGLLHRLGILGVRCHLFDFGLGIVEELFQFVNLCECGTE